MLTNCLLVRLMIDHCSLDFADIGQLKLQVGGKQYHPLPYDGSTDQSGDFDHISFMHKHYTNNIR